MFCVRQALDKVAILLLILYQLTKFEAPSYNSFRDILITSFQWPNLERAISQKKIQVTGIILYQLTKFEAGYIYTQKKKFSQYLCFLIKSTILHISLSIFLHELYYRNFTFTCLLRDK